MLGNTSAISTATTAGHRLPSYNLSISYQAVVKSFKQKWPCHLGSGVDVRLLLSADGGDNDCLQEGVLSVASMGGFRA